MDPPAEGTLVVTGTLVDAPNTNIKKWCRLLIYAHALSFICQCLEQGNLTSSVAYYLYAQFLVVGLCIPLCGIRWSSDTSGTSLAIFGAVQFALGILSVLHISVRITLMILLASACDDCAQDFELGNSTCVRSDYIMSSDDCNGTATWSMMSIWFLAMVTITSFGTWSATRKTPKMAQIVTMDASFPAIRSYAPRTMVASAPPRPPEMRPVDVFVPTQYTP